MNDRGRIAEALAACGRAWYGATIESFLASSSDEVIGRLANSSSFSVEPTQRDAWIKQVQVLKNALKGFAGAVLFEFTVPRLGRRIDTVLMIGPLVFVVEFKVGQHEFRQADVEQVWDYALDLKNFHEASHFVTLVPILIATEAAVGRPTTLTTDDDQVCRPILATPDSLRHIIESALLSLPGAVLDVPAWTSSPYKPTPTIIEAARALYAQHSVEAIARYDADAPNLRTTSARIETLIDEARSGRQKKICFVTGVPGAGKTLVGLDVATHRRDANSPTHAVYLSGNGPLVAVLREALTRDELQRRKLRGERVRKGEVSDSVEAFIQNVHHFRDEAIVNSAPPAEHVVIFDEAQRAWNLRQTASFMLRKKKRAGFSQSEPEFLIGYMDRHQDWALIVCLVGGGQEINTGETGIAAWLIAVQEKYPHWQMHISTRLTDTEYAAGAVLSQLGSQDNVALDECLHLPVSMRSFRAEHVSSFVKALLDRDRAGARQAYGKLGGRYRIYVSRDLNDAKAWIRKKARGSERYGLVASSRAQRLKPHAIDVRVEVNPVHWFLADRSDTRSSYYLEDAATQFQVQGLELDWVCVTWDGDLRWCDNDWTYHDFRGNRWTNVADEHTRRFVLNSYRVLLTRARQGMVNRPGIPGDSVD